MSNGNSPEQIEADVQAQRQQLAETVDQLATKLDVKAQAQARVASAKQALTTDEGKPTPQALAGAGAFVAALVALVVWRVRR